MTEAVIVVDRIAKTFRTNAFKPPFRALRNVSFEVERGQICGFLGPNGAGKTTTIKALLGLINIDEGELRILGERPQGNGWKRRIGYMPEHPTFYEFLTGRELVVWFARLLGLSKAEAGQRAERVLERVGLGHALDKRLRTYSKGMLQRAGLAQAIVGAPELLILDEPMTGLDPLGRRDMRELIRELAAEGVTVFYSTHILPDIEMTCDRVTIVHKGETLRTATVQDILAEATRKVHLEMDDVPAPAIAELQADHPQMVVDGSSVAFELPSEGEATAALSALLEQGARLRRFEPHRATLEEAFVSALGDTPS